ncbi:DUF2806 domain-containing protein [Bacteroides reticulotermitis]|uniref:DUF2806 domain-containing protein n=1 Tax=Bacteroides reticulotermitis TaxID=1133319 RepID=UPI003A8851A2
MDININTGLEKPFTKLIEVISNGCYYLFEPLQIKRIAKADSEASLIKAESDLKIQLKQALVDTKVAQMQSPRFQREINNIVDICGIAAQDLRYADNVSDIPVDQDWSAHFFDRAKNISDEQAKILWGKILADEIKEPNSFSYKTLEILSTMSKKEADAFTNLLKHCIDGNFFVFNPYMDSHQRILGLSNFKEPMSFGLVMPIELSITKDISESNNSIKVGNKQLYVSFEPPISKVKITFSGYGLTTAGEQLARLVNATPDDDVVNYYIELIKSKSDDIYEITLKDNCHQE